MNNIQKRPTNRARTKDMLALGKKNDILRARFSISSSPDASVTHNITCLPDHL